MNPFVLATSTFELDPDITTVPGVEHNFHHLEIIGRGFIPIVVREAVGDRDDRPHEANLFDLQAKYAEVKGMDEVLAYLKNL